MKYAIQAFMACIIAALVVSCSPKEEKSDVLEQQRDTAVDNLNEATADMKQAEQAMQDYTYAQRADFVKAMKQELGEIETELNRLSTKVDNTSGATKAEAKRQLDAVRKQWVAAKSELDKAEKTNESNWGETTRLYRKSLTDLKDSFAKTRQWLSDKIEP